MSGFRKTAGVLCLSLAVVVTSGCYLPPPPGAYAPLPNTFDRAWAAVLGAFADQGVQLVQLDRAAGTVRGTRGGVEVSADVRTQADGSVRVEFGQGGNVAADPTLSARVTQSYHFRMGR
jgi:hypothetical protein